MTDYSQYIQNSKNYEKQFAKNQQEIDTIIKNSNKLDKLFFEIQNYNNIPLLYKMDKSSKMKPNKTNSTKTIKNTKISFIKRDGTFMNEQEKQEKRSYWRQMKKKQKEKQKAHILEEANDLDNFNFDFKYMDDDDNNVNYSLKNNSPITNPFSDEILNYKHESEKSLISAFANDPLSAASTPTKTPIKKSKNGKTRKKYK